ncbi:hypothetical protein HYPSUDRAFT_161330 [Hypholoma sublateritium FD-334 SS-4]|uniref:Uncharacterized protein n=1 Tax=Hypholoma sublateritium (strain FD-334 SS-4) TaxID=945553 RepID=A0A0D2LCX3_HYPSF|nr:hypothetical protein HYPSUDRAFT_161330 [Hypholoma sublateritium FD-334 SS-4]
MNPILKWLVIGQLSAVVWLQAFMYTLRPHEYSFLGDDYPQIWTINHGIQEQVATPFENSVHFTFDSVMSEAEWESQVPHRGLIQLGKYRQTFSISMFHQLRCISLVRSDIIKRRSSNYTTNISPLTGHCLNYLRQMALCRADIDLESVLLVPNPEAHPSKYRCTNWNLIYEATLENHRMHPGSNFEVDRK